MVADRPGDVAETDEANNRFTVPGKRLLVTRPPTDANLTISGFNVITHRSPPFDGTVRNTGTAPSGPFWIEFWAAAGDPDYPTLERYFTDSILVHNLEPDEEVDLRHHNQSFYLVPEGQYTVICFVDRLDQVIETDETDNYQFVRGIER